MLLIAGVQLHDRGATMIGVQLTRVIEVGMPTAIVILRLNSVPSCRHTVRRASVLVIHYQLGLPVLVSYASRVPMVCTMINHMEMRGVIVYEGSTLLENLFQASSHDLHPHLLLPQGQQIVWGMVND